MARSAKVHADRSRVSSGSSSGLQDEARIWKKFWATKVHGKMKITMWRFAHDCLPSGMQLHHRGVPEAGDCIFCGQEESVDHALLSFSYAREVWQEVKHEFPVQLQRRALISPRVWVFLSRCSDLEATTVMTTFWHIWMHAIKSMKVATTLQFYRHKGEGV